MNTSIALDRDEAISRMQRRQKDYVCWTLGDTRIEWSYIDGKDARNYYGTLAPNPGKVALQRKVWKKFESPRYTNYW